jgi:hypothetical protein
MERDKIARIIRKLLDKTLEKGATEAEAMSAASKARELMDRYQIVLGTAAMEAEGTAKVDVSRSPYKGLTIRDRLGMRVAKLCDCRVWRSAQNGTLTFFGLSSDVEFAGWLMVSLDSFVRQQSLEYVRPYRAGGVSAREAWKLQKAFILGCCVRINERLETISKGRWSEPVTGDGRSLVVVKGAIVSKAFAKLGLRLGVGRVRRSSQASTVVLMTPGRLPATVPRSDALSTAGAVLPRSDANDPTHRLRPPDGGPWGGPHGHLHRGRSRPRPPLASASWGGPD